MPQKSRFKDAFGVEKNINSNDTNVFRYCGEYYDTETGTIYLRARYYDPSIGRFLTKDPARDGLNWYVYCENNPVVFVDPTGMFLATIIGAGIGAIGGAIGDGISAAIKGESILNGAISGAAGGAVGGAVAGMIVDACTGNPLAMAGVGIAAGAVGGLCSSVVSQTTNYCLNKKTTNVVDGLLNINLRDVGISMVAGAVFNGLGAAVFRSNELMNCFTNLELLGTSTMFSVGNATADITNGVGYTTRDILGEDLGYDSPTTVKDVIEAFKNLSNVFKGDIK